MRKTIHIPSKTYLTGEYCILKEQKALIILTSPLFAVTIEECNDPTQAIDFNNIPVEQWAISRLKNKIIQFFDPHNNKGGFGASSACFAGVWKYLNPKKKPIQSLDEFLLVQQGSGGDVLSQLTGGVALIDKKNKQTISLQWPWKNICCSLFRTQKKLLPMNTLEKLSLMPANLTK